MLVGIILLGEDNRNTFNKCLLIIALGITGLNNAQSQIFVLKDTLQKKPIFQIGVGFYSGTHQFIPNTSSKYYQNKAGYDRGFLVTGRVNFTRNWSISLDYLVQQRSAYILFENDVMKAGTFVTGAGNQFRTSINYQINNHKKHEIVSVAVGIARNKLLYDVGLPSSQSKISGYDVVSTTYRMFKQQSFEYNALVVKLSKAFSLYKSLQFVVYIENELQMNEYQVRHGIRNWSGTESIYHNSTLKSNSVRLGGYFIF